MAILNARVSVPDNPTLFEERLVTNNKTLGGIFKKYLKLILTGVKREITHLKIKIFFLQTNQWRAYSHSDFLCLANCR